MTVFPMRVWAGAVAVVAAILAIHCSRAGSPMPQPASRVSQQPFGQTSDGRSIEIITLTNANGIEVRAMTYGGIIVSLKTPNRARQFDDIVLGHDTGGDYIPNTSFFGALAG